MKLMKLIIAFVQFAVSAQMATGETINVTIKPITEVAPINQKVAATVVTNSLSQTQMDIIDAMNEFNHHPEAVFRVAEINEAVQGTWMSGGAGAVAIDELAKRFSPNTQPLFLFPEGYQRPQYKTLDQQLHDTAKNTFDSTDLDDFKNSRTEKEMNAIVDLGAASASFFGPEAALVGGIAKVGYPYFRDELARELQAHNIPMSSVQGRAILGYASAMQEIRNGSQMGKAMEPYFSQLSNNDPRMDSNNKDAIRLAKIELNSYATKQNTDDLLLQVKGYKEDFQNLEKGIAQLNVRLKGPRVTGAQTNGGQTSSEPRPQAPATQQQKQSAPTPKYDEKLVYDLRQAEGSMLVAGYLMQIAGQNEGAQVAFGLANLTDKVGNLVEKASDMAPMMLVAGYVGVAMGLVSLFSGPTKSSSPFPALFEMLKQISKQIDDLRLTLTQKLDRMDVRFGNLLNENIMISEAIKGDTVQIRQQLIQLSAKLSQISKQIRDGQFATIEYLLAKEDRECFQYNGSRQASPPYPTFQACKSGYVDRANVFSRSNLGAAKSNSVVATGWRASDELFPYGDSYEKLRLALKIPQTLDGQTIADPNAWYAATTRLLTLLRNFPQNLGEIDLDPETGSDSNDLDPTILTGRSIRDFMQKAAFKDDGKTLNKTSFEILFGNMINSYRLVLSRLHAQLRNPGVHANIQRGDAQYDPSYQFRFLKGGSVDFCKDVRPTLAESKSFLGINDGGASGWQYVAPLTRPPGHDFGTPFIVSDLEPRLNGWIQGFAKETFQPDQSILESIDADILLAEQISPADAAVNLCISRMDYRDLELVGEEYRGRLEIGYKVLTTYQNHDLFVRELSGTLNFRIPKFYMVNTRDGNIDAQGLPALVNPTMKLVHGHMSEILKRVDNPDAVEGHKVIAAIVNQKLHLAQLEMRRGTTYVDEENAVEDARHQLQLLASVGLNSHSATVNRFVARFDNEKMFPKVSELVDRVVLRGHSVKMESENFDDAIKMFEDDLAKLSETPNLQPPTDAIATRLTQLELVKEMRMAQWRQEHQNASQPVPAKLAPVVKRKASGH